MIVAKFWTTVSTKGIWRIEKDWDGIFLFGFIPLFVCLIKVMKRVL